MNSGSGKLFSGLRWLLFVRISYDHAVQDLHELVTVKSEFNFDQLWVLWPTLHATWETIAKTR